MQRVTCEVPHRVPRVMQVYVQNFSKRNRTTVNKSHVTGVQRLRDGDMIFIADRAFRFEYGELSASVSPLANGPPRPVLGSSQSQASRVWQLQR